MVNEFCGFKHGVIGTDKMPADTTLNNMKKADLIKLLHTAQHNYETLMWFYNNAVKANMSQLNNNGWISVDVELPTKNGWYWGYYVTSSYTGTDGVKNTECKYASIYWEDNLWLYDPRSFRTVDEVIAWKPIAPYQQKGE